MCLRMKIQKYTVDCYKRLKWTVHHVSFILCYTVLYDFLGLRYRFGRHRADVHRTSCALVFALIRVHKHWRDDITQGKQ